MRKFLLWFIVYSLWFMVVGAELSTLPSSEAELLRRTGNSQLSTLNLTETKLATIPEDYQQVGKIVFSANGQKVAYKVRKESKEFVVVGSPTGEKTGKPYDRVAKDLNSLLLSPDDQRVAYQARRGEKEYLVLASPTGEKEGRPYDDVSPAAFSPDGSVIVCEVGEGGKWFILLNSPAGEKETPRYDYSCDSPFFSPDSRLIFYILEDREKGERTIFATDARTLEVKKARTYAWVGAIKINLSVNGLRFAYPVKKEKEGKIFLVLSDLTLPEEKEVPPYDGIGPIAIGPDGQRVAYSARKELPTDLSAEARAKVEASAQAGGKTFLVVSDWDSPSQVKENGPYDAVGTPVFSPEGSLVAYPANKNGRWFVVSGALDGSLPHHEGKSYDWIEQPVFSPDGKKIAYPAVKDGKWCVVISPVNEPTNIKEGPAYDMVVSPIFSPDGSRVVYRARRGEGQRFIVIGDSVTGAVVKEGPVCDEVWEPRLSGDGKLVCYGVRIGRELWWKTADLH